MIAKVRSSDSAIALGHLGVLAEALSGGVGDWELRLVEADHSDFAQQAARIRGLLARAAEELDELSAALATGIDQGPDGEAAAPHLRMLRRVHLRLPGDAHRHRHHHHRDDDEHEEHHGQHRHRHEDRERPGEAPFEETHEVAHAEKRMAPHASRWVEPSEAQEALEALEELEEAEQEELERHRRR
jgi:hypothetical protein